MGYDYNKVPQAPKASDNNVTLQAIAEAQEVKPVKKSLGQKFMMAFAGDDSTISGKIMNGVIKPKLKDVAMNIFGTTVAMIGDAIIAGISAVIYDGDATQGQKYSSTGKVINTNKIAYNAAYPLANRTVQQVEKVKTNTIEPLGFTDRDSITTIIGQLQEQISIYGACSIANLYDLCGKTSYPWTYRDLGWRDVSQASISRQGTLWVLTMPPYGSIR